MDYEMCEFKRTAECNVTARQEITNYLTHLAKREHIIKDWNVRLGIDQTGNLEIFVTIESDNDFVRNTIAYGHPWFVIRDRLEAMVYDLKRMGERNRMNRIVSKFTKEEFDRYFALNTNKTAKERADDYIEKVIFSPPATVVFFKDGQKVVVKCQYGDDWDEEKALAMAIVKHDHGLPVFNKCLEKAERRYPDIDISSIIDKLSNAAPSIIQMFRKGVTENDEA